MRRIFQSREDFPACIRHFVQVRGICIGQCIEGGSGFGVVQATGHAHSYIDDTYRGWICLQYVADLRCKRTLLHEVAHLIANTRYNVPFHGKAWRKVVKDIGGTYKAYGQHPLGCRDLTHADPISKSFAWRKKYEASNDE